MDELDQMTDAALLLSLLANGMNTRYFKRIPKTGTRPGDTLCSQPMRIFTL